MNLESLADLDLTAWFEQARTRRKTWADAIAKHGASIDTRLEGLDRGGLVSVLIAEGVVTVRVDTTVAPAESLLGPLGQAVSDADLRLLVFDALLVQAVASDA